MDKIIIKYLSGTANEKEKEQLLQWIEESDKNAKFFADLKHAWTLSKTKNDPLSDKEVVHFMKMIKREKQRHLPSWWIAAAAAAVVILISSLFISMQRKIESYKEDISYMLTQAGPRYEYSTPYGVKGKVYLPDGSAVWLNSGSRISFPGKFNGKSRELDFSGEGYFEVIPDSQKPMNVRLRSGLTIKVVGTEFNLSSYDDDKKVSLLLLSGKVNINNADGKKIYSVQPNEKITINLIDNTLLRNIPQEIAPIIGWKNGWLIFDEAPLEEVFKKMERWYGQKIIVEDESVYSKKLTAKFHEESISQVFGLMNQISLINYKIVDSIAYISKFN
jgi:ferric-dicitrate binding protein FerR (iron transport regulator)